MADLHFFDNPDFREYVRALYDLHLAINAGWDETAEGEALRARMDESGSRLSREEINSLNGISADFYSLVDTPPGEVSPITAELMADLGSVQQARKANDFNRALELSRKHVDRIPPARLAYLRGSVWMEAREYPIAAMFMQRASALEPDNSNFRYLALHSLWQADPSAAARHAQTILSDFEKYPPGLVLKAADILAHQPRARPGDQVRPQRDSPIPILHQDFLFQHETSGEAEVHKLSLGEDLAGRGILASLMLAKDWLDDEVLPDEAGATREGLVPHDRRRLRRSLALTNRDRFRIRRIPAIMSHGMPHSTA